MKSRSPERGQAGGGTALSGLGVGLLHANYDRLTVRTARKLGHLLIKKNLYIQNNIQVVEEVRLPFRLPIATCVEIWFGRTPMGHGTWGTGSIRIRFA